LIGCLLTNLSTFDLVSAKLIAIISTSFSLNDAWALLSSGISLIHGTHQVAQKLRITALFFKSEDLKISPLKVSNSKLGAGPPTRRGGLDIPDKKKLKKITMVNLDINKNLETI
jgi:hypothetical protein